MVLLDRGWVVTMVSQVVKMLQASYSDVSDHFSGIADGC